jgi:signal peptidase II
LTETLTPEDEKQKSKPTKRTFKELLPDYVILILIAGLIIFLDIWTKNWVRANIPFRGTWMPWEWLAPYARIVNWHNSGAAFGMFQNLSMIFTVLAFIVVGVILWYFPQVPKEDWALRLAMSLQLGGAIGNLIDRLRFGVVTDFISIGNFAVFNVADSSISVGVAVLLISIWIMERKEKAHQRNNDDPVEATPGD